MKLTIERIIILSIVIFGYIQVTIAQPSGKKKMNISLNFGKATNDSAQISYINLGFLSNIHQLKGAGINIISSITTSNASGIQLSGISNIVGNNVNGMQLGGITNVNGNNASGVILSGLVNITGKNSNGVSISGGINIAGSHSNGFSFGGLLNTVAGETNGLQIGGIANITGEKSNGAIISGLLNVTGANLSGVQLSSLLNITGDHLLGLQLSALGNVGVNVEGMQLSGISNVAAENLHGLQFSPLSNFAKNVKGAQIGLLNYCMGKLSGLQLGLVNYSKDSSKVKIGLVNLSPHTRIQLLVFGGNTTKANLAVRFLNHLTYTMIGTGTQYTGWDKDFSLTAFYRAGLRFSLTEQLAISGDLGFAHIENFKNKTLLNIPANMYSLQARINLEYQPLKRFGIFASGGFAHTRFYKRNKTFENKPIVELGILLF